jgi:CRISPR-associated exonuclease Cas4
MEQPSKVTEEATIVGSLVQAYSICPRQAWLMSRQVTPDEDNVYLQLGRLIQSQAYSRERKELHLGHLALDLIKREGKTLVVAEVKKSSRASGAARLQLGFYLYELKKMGIEAEGELLFPEERYREAIILDENLEKEIEELKKKIWALIYQPLPPHPEKRGRFCGKCAYNEFCWA